ncbi:MAG: hypothetical protein JNK02_02665 [Planctomycetes bacterium]|nr:hypothetical protein [Planctomycetota bacterium]
MLLVTTALTLLPSLDTDLLASPLAPFVAPAPAAQEKEDWTFSYTYVELGAARYNVDVIDEDADVFYGRASVGFLGFLYGFGQYTNQSFDFEDTSTDLIQLGVGAHFGVLPNLDLFGEIGWLYNDISSDLGDNDDTGYSVEGGARWMPLRWGGGGLELDGSLGYLDLEGVSDEDKPFFWELGARFHFLTSFSIGAAYQMIEDDDQVVLNARFSF